MYVKLQRRLKGWLPNMHGQHPGPVIGPCIVVTNVEDLLLGDHVRACATPPKLPTETIIAVAVNHCNGVVYASTLKQMHCGKGIFYLLL